VSAEALARIEAKLDRLLAQTGPRKPREDGKVFKDLKEKYWTGESYAGCAFSECSPDFLRAFAKYKLACVWAANDAFKKTGKQDELSHVEKNTAEAKLAHDWAEFQEASGNAASAPKLAPRTVEREADEDAQVPF
jgi:hypothetical protein